MPPATPVVDLPTLPAPAAQCDRTGAPRFVLEGPAEDAAWQAAVAAESDGGVDAEHRLFLDAQLEAGDLLVDFAPSFGFVALGAATAPDGGAAIAVLEDPAQADRLVRAAEAAAARLRVLSADALRDVDLSGEPGRLFGRANPATVADALRTLAPWIAEGRVVALLLSSSAHDPATGATGGTADIAAEAAAAAWQGALDAVISAGFRPHALVEVEGDVQLVAVPQAPPGTALIALHHGVLAPDADEAEATAAAASDAAASDAPPTDAATTAAPSASAHRASASSAAVAPPTLNLIAPFQRTGYGIVGANLLRALLDEGADVSFFPMGGVDRRLVDVPGLDAALAAQARFDADAPSVRIAQQFDLALHAGRGPRVGFPIFEGTRFTSHERHHLRAQDRLLVCTEWARGVLLANGIAHVPVSVVPLGVDRRVFHEGVAPGPRAAADETVFLQVGKLEDRKAQRELLRAFEAAFTPRDAVRLELLCHNPFLSPEAFEEAIAPFRRSPMARRITLHTAPLPTQHEVAARMAAADCGVFCSRAEGWNLEALEMLSMGKPVIATAYSAHTAFLDARNARLVDVDALAPHPVYGEWAAWGEAQHEQLVAHLRAVHAARRTGPLDVNTAGLETARRHGWRDSARALLGAIA